ncbi:MAG TPA: hypothetical protein VFV49_12460, partial [Thermoanaerobaculia bacterium]|nr:hypothetical protein [Thermoanaerobaculia bacterium]
MQGAVLPKGCGTIVEGLDLDSHPLTELTARDHVLSTTLAVSVNPRVVIPNYKHVRLDRARSPWHCTTSLLDLRNYVDPVTGKVAFPGPTLRITRASELYWPGDRIEILL